MADETLTLTVDDHPETLDKIGARFAAIEPGTTLIVRMPLDLGLMFLEDPDASVPPPGGEEVNMAGDFEAFTAKHCDLCARYYLNMFQEGEEALAELTMEKLPASSLT